MSREELEAALVRSPHPKGRGSQYRRVAGIEDYLFIKGDQMTLSAAAERLGVNPRTIVRYRAVLRTIGSST